VKFLVDNQLPPALARWIARQSGCSSFHVADKGMSEFSDADIWHFAADHGLVLVSKDEDFANLHAKRGETEPGCPMVLWVRLGNCRRAQLLKAFETTWPAIIRGFESGEGLIELR
jgi:predicted nuclease of predicted toxin-antitoxin system